MSQTAMTIVIATVGVLLSVLSSSFLSGMRWGEVRSEMRYMNDRLAKIEGMFTLTPKEQERMMKHE